MSHYLTLAGACLLSSIAQAGDCTFAPLPLQASVAAPALFIGQGQRIEVRFQHDNPAITDPVAFPEPPVLLVDRRQQRHCAIDQGGIWARSPLYLSKDETRLVTYGYSGSNAELVVYDTHSCSVLTRQDVSGMRVALTETQVLLGQDCQGEDIASCTTQKSQPLSRLCQP